MWYPPKLSYPISGHRGALFKSSQSPFDLLYPVQWSKMTYKLCAKVNKLEKKIPVTFNKSSMWESRSTKYEATFSTNIFLAKKKTDLFHCNGGEGESELDFLSKHRCWPKPRRGGAGGVTQQSLNRNFALRLNPLPFWTIFDKQGSSFVHLSF